MADYFGSFFKRSVNPATPFGPLGALFGAGDYGEQKPQQQAQAIPDPGYTGGGKLFPQAAQPASAMQGQSSGSKYGLNLPDSTPAAQAGTSAVAQRVPEYESAVRASIEANTKRAAEVEARIKGQQSPFSQGALTARQGLARDQISRNASGNQGKLLALAGGRQMGDSAVAGAMGRLYAGQQREFSDSSRQLMNDYEDRNAAFQSDQNQNLMRLASGDFSGAQSGYMGLLGVGVNQNNADRGYDLSESAQKFSQNQQSMRTPLELEGMGLQNQMSEAQVADFKQNMGPRLKAAIANGRITESQAAEAEWIEANKGPLAAIQFIASLAGGGGKLIAGLV